MINRKAAPDDVTSGLKDPSLHGMLVVLGMTCTIAFIVIVFAYGASDATLFGGILEKLPTLEGLEIQIQDGYNALVVYIGNVQQLFSQGMNIVSSLF